MCPGGDESLTRWAADATRIDMSVNAHRLVVVSSLLFALPLLTGCTKSEAACQGSAQCQEGFVCSESGTCQASGGLDADLDPADATPACPEATHFCAAPAPTDWSGPVAGTQAEQSATLAACSGDYATEASAVFEGLVSAGACSCTCSGNATNMTCSNATLAERSNCVGCSAIETCNSLQVPSNNACTSVPGTLGDKDILRVSMGAVTGSGDCAEGQASDDLSSFFASQERYCSADSVVASCPADGVCMPNVVEPAFGSMCIFQAGDHECPTSYPAKELRYQGFDSTRACSACSCSGPDAGSSCGGTVEIGDGACISVIQITASSCVTNLISSNGSSGARYQPGSFACAPSGAEITGEATPTGQTTFCCTEPIPEPVLN